MRHSSVSSRAGSASPLHNQTLGGQLEARVEALRASRCRLIAAQDAARHRLERNLHDGAQQRLVAVKVRLSIAEHMAAKAELGPQSLADT